MVDLCYICFATTKTKLKCPHWRIFVFVCVNTDKPAPSFALAFYLTPVGLDAVELELELMVGTCCDFFRFSFAASTTPCLLLNRGAVLRNSEFPVGGEGTAVS